MQELLIDYDPMLELTFPLERARIVNLCALITGNRDVAEDLAQETFFEAWRSRSKMVDPAGLSKWLSVITRNVCLRWIREQGRQSRYMVDPGLDERMESAKIFPTSNPDIEIELERDDLADLLDRAMSHLPADTREALIHKYILEMPQSDIASRLGMSEGALEARLHRGKISLHRLLLTDLRAEADTYGLVDATVDQWQETNLWCPICGQHKLYGQLPTSGISFELHCPHCSWPPKAFFAQSTMMEELKGVKGYRAILNRLVAYMNRHFISGLGDGVAICKKCGRPVQMRYDLPAYVPTYPGLGKRGASIKCQACGASSYADIYGIAIDTPAGQSFWRQNPKMRTLPEKEIDAAGRAALLVRFESVKSAATLDVILDRQRYTILGVNAGPVRPITESLS